MQFKYGISDSDIEEHPELLSISRLVLHDKERVIGYYIVESVGLDKTKGTKEQENRLWCIC